MQIGDTTRNALLEISNILQRTESLPKAKPLFEVVDKEKFNKFLHSYVKTQQGKVPQTVPPQRVQPTKTTKSLRTQAPQRVSLPSKTSKSIRDLLWKQGSQQHSQQRYNL